MLTFDLDWQSALVTLLNMVIVGLLASHWRLKLLGYLATALGLLALMQWLAWLDIDDTVWPPALAVLALVYGVIGYGLRRWRQEGVDLPRWLDVWERPLVRAGWLVSLAALVNGLILSGGIVSSLPGLLVLNGGLLQAEIEIAMWVRTLALLGLLYLTAALVERRPRLSYLALLLLLASWSLWLLLFKEPANYNFTLYRLVSTSC